MIPARTAAGRPRSERVDTAILKAALELFAAGGLANMSYEKIARLSGVSRSAIHRRWKSLGDIAAAALRAARQEADSGLPNWETLPYEDLVKWLVSKLPVAMMDPANLNLLRRVAALGDEERAFKQAYWSDVLEPRRRSFAKMISIARAEGKLPAGADPELLQDLMTGGLMNRLLFDPRPISEAGLRRYLVEILAALGLLPAALADTDPASAAGE